MAGTEYRPQIVIFLFLQCGRPVEVKVCPECKVQIGGAGYRLSQGNTTAQRYGIALSLITSTVPLHGLIH